MKELVQTLFAPFLVPSEHLLLTVLKLLKPPAISLSHLAWVTYQKDVAL